MVASRITSCSVQTSYLLSHRELNHGYPICTEPVLIPLTSRLHSGLIWVRLFVKHSSFQFHNNPAHHGWTCGFNHVLRILQTAAHKTNTSHRSHLLGYRTKPEQERLAILTQKHHQVQYLQLHDQI